MWQYNYSDQELYHYGVKGMKWGRRKQTSSGQKTTGSNRKQQETDYRKKLTKLSSSKNVSESDKKRFKYRNDSAAARFGKIAAKNIASTLILDTLRGDIKKYSGMSKTEIAKSLSKKAASIAVRSSAEMAINDTLAKSASKKYSNSGKRVDGKKASAITREDVIETGVGLATQALTIAAFVGGMKMASANQAKARNEARFNAWGQNILPQKVDNVIWQSNDLNYAVIDNR